MAPRRQGASPWARPAGGRRLPREAGARRGPASQQLPLSRNRDSSAPARPVRPPRPVDSRCCPAVAMCAARTPPPLAHIFRGTFVHSTWTCPMEVLRDHLLGVSDSGKVSGHGVQGTAGRWRDSGAVLLIPVRSGTERALWLWS